MFELDDEADFQPQERDRYLSFRWRTINTDLIRSLGVEPSADKDYNATINSMLTEAVLAAGEGRWTSYPRNKNVYSERRRYHGTAYTYRTVLRAIEEMLKLGLIEEERSLPGQLGWQSRYRATAQLMEALAEAEFRYELFEPIHLKSPEGFLMDYKDTDLTRRMRREMQEINEFLASIDLQYPPDAVLTAHHALIGGTYIRRGQPVLYRVFNRGRFSMGGRAYGCWQSMPKAERERCRINGEPVAEPDFEQLHPAILYAQRGLTLKHDAYETGEFPRKLGKLAFLVAMNTDDRRGTIAALLNKNRPKKDGTKGNGWPLSGQKTSRLLMALDRRNPDIKDALHSDQGIKLMRTDSEIAIRTVKRCMNAGIPVLPVHDSMVVPMRYEGQTAEFMEESAARVLHHVKPCRVSVSRPPVLQMPFGPSSLPVLSPAFPVQLPLFPAEPCLGLAAQVKEIRERLGLSQRALGEKIGCRQPHIANIEKERDRLGDWPLRRLHDLMREAA